MPMEYISQHQNSITDIISSTAPVLWDALKSGILAVIAFMSAISGRQIERLRGEMMSRIDRLDAQVEGLRERIDNQLAHFEKRLDDLASDYREFKRDVHNFLRRQ